jgi:competence protein ComEA
MILNAPGFRFIAAGREVSLVADSLQHSEDSDRHSDSCAESVSVAPNVSVVTPAFDPAPSQAALQADTGNLQPDSGPAGEPDRFLALLGWLVFVVLSVQYLIVAFDRPPPLPWQRGPAFSFYRVDVNTGTWVEWMQLEGIGQTMAHRIVANREEFGPFPTIDELTRVDGIGPVTLDRLRPWLTISHEDDEQRIRQHAAGK